MKKYLLIIASALLATSFSVNAQTQTFREIRQQMKEKTAYSREEINKKASKDARNEAKRYKKEGWSAVPGSLPMEKQFDRAYALEYEMDDNLYPKYIMGTAMSTGGNFDAARMQALELAKQNIAGEIQTEITALIENTVSNDQLGKDEANSITRSVMASKNLISQSIGRTVTVVELYRTLSNQNKQVLVRIAYNSDMALKEAKHALHNKLELQSEELHNKLNNILGMEE